MHRPPRHQIPHLSIRVIPAYCPLHTWSHVSRNRNNGIDGHRCGWTRCCLFGLLWGTIGSWTLLDWVLVCDSYERRKRRIFILFLGRWHILYNVTDGKQKPFISVYYHHIRAEERDQNILDSLPWPIPSQLLISYLVKFPLQNLI